MLDYFYNVTYVYGYVTSISKEEARRQIFELSSNRPLQKDDVLHIDGKVFVVVQVAATVDTSPRVPIANRFTLLLALNKHQE